MPEQILEDFGYVVLQKILLLMIPKLSWYHFFPGLPHFGASTAGLIIYCLGTICTQCGGIASTHSNRALLMNGTVHDEVSPAQVPFQSEDIAFDDGKLATYKECML